MDSSVTTLPDERWREVRHRVGQFTLELVKALLQTGYYSADHPASKTIAHDLYQRFLDITRDAYELMYILVSTVDERGVMIEGITPEAIEVARALRGVMGDHFVVKFHDYFVRNRIASFTIKREIEEAEFAAFLGLWVGWGARLASIERQKATALMREELSRAGVFGVNVVGMDEVPGQSRHLPWTTRLTLGRLRTEIGRLKDVQLRPEAHKELKSRLIGDVIRPIRRPATIAEVLIHADLVSDAGSNTSEIGDLLTEAIPPNSLLAVTERLLDDVESHKRQTQVASPGQDPTVHRDAVERAARLVTARLERLAPPDAAPIIERAYGLDLIEVDALPEEIRRKVKARKLCDRFLESQDLYLRDFESCTAPKSYLKYLNVITVIFPELVQRGEDKALGAILMVFDRHLKEEAPPFVGRTRFIEETLAAIERSGALQGLVALACRTPKDARAALEAGVALFRGRAVPGLVARLGAEDVSERAAAVAILSKIGKDAIPAILEELRSHRHPWYTVRNLIAILGEAGDRSSLSVLRTFMRHPHPKVREEVVQTISLILGDEAENALLPFLQDDSAVVARKAIHHLGNLRSVAPAFLERMYEAIRLRARAEDEPDHALQAACLAALANYDQKSLPEKPDFEGALIKVVRPSPVRTRLPGRFGVRPKPIETVVLAIRALGAFGGGRSLSVLEDLITKAPEEVREAAIEAAEKVRNRLTKQVTRSPHRY